MTSPLRKKVGTFASTSGDSIVDERALPSPREVTLRGVHMAYRGIVSLVWNAGTRLHKVMTYVAGVQQLAIDIHDSADQNMANNPSISEGGATLPEMSVKGALRELRDISTEVARSMASHGETLQRMEGALAAVWKSLRTRHAELHPWPWLERLAQKTKQPSDKKSKATAPRTAPPDTIALQHGFSSASAIAGAARTACVEALLAAQQGSTKVESSRSLLQSASRKLVGSVERYGVQSSRQPYMPIRWPGPEWPEPPLPSRQLQNAQSDSAVNQHPPEPARSHPPYHHGPGVIGKAVGSARQRQPSLPKKSRDAARDRGKALLRSSAAADTSDQDVNGGEGPLDVAAVRQHDFEDAGREEVCGDSEEEGEFEEGARADEFELEEPEPEEEGEECAEKEGAEELQKEGAEEEGAVEEGGNEEEEEEEGEEEEGEEEEGEEEEGEEEEGEEETGLDR